MENELEKLTEDQLKNRLKTNSVLQGLLYVLTFVLFVLIPISRRYELFAIIIFLLIVIYMVVNLRKRLNAEIERRSDN